MGITALSLVIERKEGLLDRTWVAGKPQNGHSEGEGGGGSACSTFRLAMEKGGREGREWGNMDTKQKHFVTKKHFWVIHNNIDYIFPYTDVRRQFS